MEGEEPEGDDEELVEVTTFIVPNVFVAIQGVETVPLMLLQTVPCHGHDHQVWLDAQGPHDVKVWWS